MAADSTDALSPQDASRVDAWWRAANYLSVGQIYLIDNPLLRRPLEPEHIKPRLLGHWGTTPGLNFIYAHMNHAIRQRNLSVIDVTGPGHGGPAMVANAYLDGTYSEIYTRITRDEEGLRRLFSAVVLSRWDPQPRRTRDAGVDPRGRGAWLLAAPRLRRGVRQPGPARAVRGRRR